MGKSGNGISAASEDMSRPSLLSTGTPTVDHNILDAMARQAPPQPARASRSPSWVWLLMPLLAAAGWYVAKPLLSPPLDQAVAPPRMAINTPPVPAPATAANTPTATVAISIASSTPATPNPFDTLQTVVPDIAPEPVDEAPATLLATVKPKAPRMVPVAPQAPEIAPLAAATQTPLAKGAPKDSAKPNKKAPARVRAVAKTTPPASKTPKGQDPDVELLTAIMKHLGKSHAQPAQIGSTQTIAELVKSCKRKDQIEALLCQRSICEGSWGKAQACPLNLAPKSAIQNTASKTSGASTRPITDPTPDPVRR